MHAYHSYNVSVYHHMCMCIIVNVSTYRQMCMCIIVNVIGERAKRARHSQVCSIENRIYIIIYYGTCNFVLITRKEGGA